MNLSTAPFTGALYRAEQTRALDRIAIEQSGVTGFELMSRAGRSAYHLLQQRWPDAENVVVVCGPGNNGGDGFVLATLAKRHQQSPQVLLIGGDEAVQRLQGEALQAYQQACEYQVPIVPFSAELLSGADVIVDAMLGTGLSGDVRGDYVTAIAAMNAVNTPVLAIDIPSGICSDSGRVLGCAVNADLTITFIALKQGLMTHQGLEHRGELVMDDLNVDSKVYEQVVADTRLIDQHLINSALPARTLNAHKGSHGHLLVVAGGKGMAGAGLMAAEAALRSGAGLVTLATRPENIMAANIRCPEIMTCALDDEQALLPLLSRVDALLVGPGLGQSDWSAALLKVLAQSALPSVWDADGLNYLAQQTENKPQGQRLITPHPGEAGRLLGVSTAKIQANRFEAAKLLQQRYGGVAVLKGAGSLVAANQQTWLCQRGNPGMAAGGMGDVLGGIIAGLHAQGLSALAAAACGVEIHAHAADLQAAVSGERGLRATDLFAQLGPLLNPVKR